MVEADVELMQLRAEEKELMEQLQDESKQPDHFDHEIAQVSRAAPDTWLWAFSAAARARKISLLSLLRFS